MKDSLVSSSPHAESISSHRLFEERESSEWEVRVATGRQDNQRPGAVPLQDTPCPGTVIAFAGKSARLPSSHLHEIWTAVDVRQQVHQSLGSRVMLDVSQSED